MNKYLKVALYTIAGIAIVIALLVLFIWAGIDCAGTIVKDVTGK